MLNTEHRTPNVEMKLECLNVKVVVELGVSTQLGENGFALGCGENTQRCPFGKRDP